MPVAWRRPSHRNTETPQAEFCELCGALVGAADRILATAEGLNGRYICGRHGTLGTEPSYNDLGGTLAVNPRPAEIEPHSGQNWAVEEEGW